MRILLDTHAWLWLMLEPARIGPATRALVEAGEHTFLLSIASVWELAIKHAAGRLTLPEPPHAYVQSRTRADGIRVLAISVAHACRSAELPRHHADPFDRLLVAQAELEQLTILTHDQHIPRYGVAVRDPSA
ncbi:MAG TPA: type II toxin-antitoxin system VapC family toxin [Kofleriaceae bacterium]|jgi:PIN domain nuclease of toxin-antitoxin system|nr:type II toxin-antitoxin system VapC family toxin [Kofleriaceae bacterium]